MPLNNLQYVGHESWLLRNKLFCLELVCLCVCVWGVLRVICTDPLGLLAGDLGTLARRAKTGAQSLRIQGAINFRVPKFNYTKFASSLVSNFRSALPALLDVWRRKFLPAK